MDRMVFLHSQLHPDVCNGPNILFVTGNSGLLVNCSSNVFGISSRIWQNSESICIRD